METVQNNSSRIAVSVIGENTPLCGLAPDYNICCSNSHVGGGRAGIKRLRMVIVVDSVSVPGTRAFHRQYYPHCTDGETAA